MINNLTPEMQKRLDLWKANTLPVKSADILRKKSPGNYVARHKDYGDDFSDFENKEKDREQQNNSIFTGLK